MRILRLEFFRESYGARLSRIEQGKGEVFVSVWTKGYARKLFKDFEVKIWKPSPLNFFMVIEATKPFLDGFWQNLKGGIDLTKKPSESREKQMKDTIPRGTTARKRALDFTWEKKNKCLIQEIDRKYDPPSLSLNQGQD